MCLAKVEDVLDVGSGEPLFSKFGFEDWTLLSLRCDLESLKDICSCVGGKGENRSWKELLGIFWKVFGGIGVPWGGPGTVS